MKTFNDFKLEQEKNEIANLICDLGIDPDAYFAEELSIFISEHVMEEGIFKKMGDWWKKNVSVPNTVRLQSSYDQAKQGIDNFVKNMIALRKQGHGQNMVGTGLYSALKQIKQNLTSMKDHVAQMDQHARQGVMNTPYADVGNWDGSPTPTPGQMAQQGGQAMANKAKQGAAYVGDKMGGMKKSWDDWMRRRRQPDQTYDSGGGI